MQEPLETGSKVLDDDEGFRQHFRHLLLGVLFETPEFLQRLLVKADKTSSKAYGSFQRWFRLSPTAGSSARSGTAMTTALRVVKK